MFKKETCCICEKNKGDKKIIEGMVCKSCISKCGHFLLTLNWKNVSSDRILQAINANEQNQEYLNIFHPTNKFEKYLELDNENKLWKSPCFSPSIIFSFDDIIDYELLQDGDTLIKGSTSGAIVGGALLGGVGAVVGATVGTKKIRQEISEYRIKIITRNLCYPEVYINFLVTGKVKSNSLLYKTFEGNAQRVLSLLATMVDYSSNNTSLSIDVPEEIIKYKKLLDDGVITQEEFNIKKTELLNI